MQLSTLRSALTVIVVFLCVLTPTRGQVPEDCEGAIVICSDEIINFNPNGIGQDDFANPNNDNGCLLTGEREGLWFFFSFRTDMPPDSEIEFTVTPAGNQNEDYDFAIYGPDLTCDSLGSPVRCSFFFQFCIDRFGRTYPCPETGLGRGATDVSELQFYEEPTNDGFVAPMVVQPGEGFYMFMDNFGLTARAFQLEWGGSAAPYLNCLANPICNTKDIDIGADMQLCFDDTVLPLEATLTNATPEAEVRWSAEPAIAATFLDDSTSLTPVANIPIDFVGEIVYTATLLDEGCEKIDRMKVFVNRPDVSIRGDTAYCTGEPTTLSVPEGYVRYRWSTGANTPSIEVSSPGLYWVEIEDSLGCVARGEINVDVFAPLLFEVEGPDTVCLNEVANLRSSPGFASYEWSTGNTSPDVFVTGSGQYSVTATDDNGCTYIDSLQLNEWAPPDPALFGDTSFCRGVTSAISAAPGFVSYEWSTGETTPSITVSQEAVYSVTVTDANTCQGTGDFEVTEAILPKPIISGTLNICTGTSTELAVDTVFRNILWSTGETTPAITVDVGGEYSVMVEDSLGCQGLDTVTVSENALPEILAQGAAGFCPGDSVVLDPGQEFVTYLWSTGESSSMITVDQTGSYGLTVTDENGCRANGVIDVVAFAEPPVSITSDFTFCPGDSVAVQVDQNYPTYEWSEAKRGKTAFFDQAGNYSVTVTDNNGCKADLDFNVDRDTMPAVAISGDRAICPEATASLNAPPGFASYTWSTGQVTTDIVVDTAGLYWLAVTDDNGCIGRDSVVLTENPAPSTTIAGGAGLCPGDTTQLEVADDFAAYLWSNGETGRQITVTQTGTYTVQITDDFGCQAEVSREVASYTPPTPEIIGRDAFCEGYTAVLQVSQDYVDFQWSTDDDRYLTVINSEGTYSVTVTDENGCQGEASKFVRVNPRPDFDIDGDPRFCPGEQAVLSVGDGFEAYIWSTGGREPTETVSVADYYSVVVRDANNCLLAKGLQVEANPAPQPAITGDSIICRDGGETNLVLNENFAGYDWSTGEAAPSIRVTQANTYTVTVTDNNNCRAEAAFEVRDQPNPVPALIGDLGFCVGGATDLRIDELYDSYQWSTGADTDQIRIDRAGDYGVTVTDFLGCVGTMAFTVEEFSMPLVELSSEIKVCPDVDARIDGGDGFAGYLWSNGDTSRFLETDQFGFYALTVTDENGCVDSTSTVLDPLDPPMVTLPEDRQFCPGTTAEVTAEAGFKTYAWSDSTQGSVLVTSTPGTYRLIVTDENDCAASDSITLSFFPTEDPIIEGPDSLCLNENSLLSVQQNFRSYDWMYFLDNGLSIDNDSTAQLRITGGGRFNLTVTDANDCMTEQTFEVASLPLPVFDLVGDRSLCEGVQAAVGVSPAFPRYAWSNGSADSLAVFFDPGDYSVTVEDEFGCESTQTFSLQEEEAPMADAGPDLEFPCTDESIQIGGTQNQTGPNIRYRWVGPGITAENYNIANPVVSEPGDYFFLVIDTITGCQSNIQEMKLTGGLGEYEVTLTVPDNIDCQTGTVEIDASRTAKLDSLTFQWLDMGRQPIAGAESPQVRVDAPGWYYLETFLDDSRCARIDSIEVRTDFLAPVAEAGRDQALTCERPTIQLNAGASSQGVGLTYEWGLADNNGTFLHEGQTFGVDRPGQYVLTVANTNNGCENSDTIAINLDQRKPNAVLAGDAALDCLNPTAMLDGSASDTGPDIRYIWRDIGRDRRLGERSNQLPVSGAGRYALIVENDRNGCLDTAYAEVIDNIDLPELTGLNAVSPICFSDRNGFIQIEEVQGGAPPYLYSFDGGASFSTRNRLDGLTGGEYVVMIEDTEGCRVERTVELVNGNVIALDLGPDQTINLGEEVQIGASVRSSEASVVFQWLEPDTFRQETSRTIIDRPFSDRIFVATVRDEDGCEATDTTLVKVLINREVYIPNVFRPEGYDQIGNSRFTVFASAQVKEIKKLAVYDRWGELMFVNENFAPNDVELGWDGRFRGSDAQQGVYVYYCEVVFQDGEEEILSGDVTLVR